MATLYVTLYLLVSVSVVCHCLVVDFYETYFIEPTMDGRNALRLAAYKWPNGIVPYLFDENSCDQHYRDTVLDAMSVLEQASCVHFIPKTDDQVEHIRFNKSELGCGSSIGYRPAQREPLDVVLDDFCLSLPGAVQHELLHVLGLFHEHTRPDRDEYVEILWDNIEPEFRQNFLKGSYDYMETFGLPYDYRSVMHYPTYAFARPGTTETMVSRQNRSATLGQTEAASTLDLEKIRRMYEC
ncbi:zinc metalloproteinase nas-14-like [Sabethes cyaneus]|uniref:zinc metalloproteinase nas-14-like n=1 Tax=Sabethes cyaneus TaxID=53552 RepID=UPI00237DB499|nr:zinc metalloproteinase nas-14-like [Sabethes cyaneus]